MPRKRYVLGSHASSIAWLHLKAAWASTPVLLARRRSTCERRRKVRWETCGATVTTEGGTYTLETVFGGEKAGGADAVVDEPTAEGESEMWLARKKGRNVLEDGAGDNGDESAARRLRVAWVGDEWRETTTYVRRKIIW
jgi:hypothetical protein